MHRVETAADNQQEVSAADECLDLRLVRRGLDGKRMPRHDTASGVRRDDRCTESLREGLKGRMPVLATLRDSAAGPDEDAWRLGDEVREGVHVDG